MTDLFLIAHKVRGEPAFDVATQITCPECLGHSCSECDDLGHWWIIPTSGHRAYPYARWDFYELMVGNTIDGYIGINAVLPIMPESLPDHYPTRATPTISLAEALGLKPKPLPPIVRRL